MLLMMSICITQRSSDMQWKSSVRAIHRLLKSKEQSVLTESCHVELLAGVFTLPVVTANSQASVSSRAGVGHSLLWEACPGHK